MRRKSKEFKEEAIRVASTSNQSVIKTAKNLGVKAGTLYSWIAAAKDDSSIISNKRNTQMLDDELSQIRKENSQLKSEREILKKAFALLLKD